MNINSDRKKYTAQILTYAGLIPFALLSLGVITHVTLIDCALALRVYGIAIASFLGGIQWAVYLLFDGKCRYNFLILSNLITLVACGTILLTHGPYSYLIQSLCFALLLTFDHEIAHAAVTPVWYYKLRCHATVAVIAILLATACLS